MSPSVRPADVDYNVAQIIKHIDDCHNKGVELVLFPELCITGYTCGDLFSQKILLENAILGIKEICENCREKQIAVVVGAPIMYKSSLYNCGVIIFDGKLYGIVPKTHIPEYGEFYEKRWFRSGENIKNICIDLPGLTINRENVAFGIDLLFELNGCKLGIEICEDLWVPTPPSSNMTREGAEIILNLSASNELIGKHSYLLDLIKNQSARCRCGYVYSSAGCGESSTDLAFSGNCIIAENGVLLTESNRFEIEDKCEIADIDLDILRHDRAHCNTFADGVDMKEEYRLIKIGHTSTIYQQKKELLRYVNPNPFVNYDRDTLKNRCDEISSIQAWGLAMRLKAINCKKAVVGISGGLDSTLALLVTVKAFEMLGYDKKGIIGITMPGCGTTNRTKSNATLLMELLGVTSIEIPIGEAVKQHFHDIGHDGKTPDVTFENSQARERTQILMDMANKENAIVIGTGDLSELALGWCTYNGDQMSMYGVNASIPKTMVKYLVEGYATNTDNADLASVLMDIIDTPISPELLPPDASDNINQKTEDLVGPYQLHDFFLYNMLRYGFAPSKIYHLACKAHKGKYDKSEIKHWLRTFYRRFFNQQFKRSCMPDGIKVGSVCLSPRGDWRMPSDASSSIWLKEVDEIEI